MGSGCASGTPASRELYTLDDQTSFGRALRKPFYPIPFPDGFNTGGSKEEKYVGLRESYYAWKWGDTVFVVLDPYWYTPRLPELNGDWSVTLGRLCRGLTKFESSGKSRRKGAIENLTGAGISLERGLFSEDGRQPVLTESKVEG